MRRRAGQGAADAGVRDVHVLRAEAEALERQLDEVRRRIAEREPASE